MKREKRQHARIANSFRRRAILWLKEQEKLDSAEGISNSQLLTMVVPLLPESNQRFIAHELTNNHDRMAWFARWIPSKWRTERKDTRTYKQPQNDGFYDRREWRELRYRVLKMYGARCQCCGNRPSEGNPLHVDHIKPRSKYPELELEFSNLQVLCKDCNLGKRAWDITDWRFLEIKVPLYS